jgi:hypothetical protein
MLFASLIKVPIVDKYSTIFLTDLLGLTLANLADIRNWIWKVAANLEVLGFGSMEKRTFEPQSTAIILN